MKDLTIKGKEGNVTMTKVKILAIIKYLLEKITGKLQGKADVKHTHSEYADKNHTHNNYLTAHPTVTSNSPTSNSSTLSWGDEFTAYSEITKDTNGHITGGELTTYTLPSSGGSGEEITDEDIDEICREVWGE